MKVATIGFFDGVHKGHQFLIKQVVEEAQRRNASSLVVTFVNHPRMIVSKSADCKLLTTSEEKFQLLRQQGIDEVDCTEFTEETSRMSAREFMQTRLKEQLGIDVLVIGYDHRFGHNREDGFEDYVRYGKEIGIEVIQATAFAEQSVPVSSSSIRDALNKGDVVEANNLLGYRFFVEGKVVNGHHVGRRIGYPTANIDVSDTKLLPRNGVYYVEVEVEGQHYPGMLNIGNCPTFGCRNKSVEVNLLDFEGDLYNKEVTLRFVEHLRDEQKFEDEEMLKRQIAHDESEIRKLIGR